MENQIHRQADPKDIAENKTLAAISYLGVLCLIPLLLKKESPFVQFHAKQGLVLFIAEIILCFVNIIPFLGQIMWLVVCLIFVIVSIQGIIKTLKGEWWTIPIISDYAKKINL